MPQHERYRLAGHLLRTKRRGDRHLLHRPNHGGFATMATHCCSHATTSERKAGRGGHRVIAPTPLHTRTYSIDLPPERGVLRSSNPGFGLELEQAMAITNETQPMKCSSCGSDRTTGDDQPSGLSASICPECGYVLGNSDDIHEGRGFLTRLSRFGLGVKHRPLFQDHRKERPQ